MKHWWKAGIVMWMGLGSTAADDLADLPDPTKPYSLVGSETSEEGPAKAESLKLQSIMVMPGNNYAIINNQRVSEGAYIDGVRVESIRSDGVMVATDSERRLLTLGGSAIVKQR